METREKGAFFLLSGIRTSGKLALSTQGSDGTPSSRALAGEAQENVAGPVSTSDFDSAPKRHFSLLGRPKA